MVSAAGPISLEKYSLSYKALFVLFVFLGSITSATNILDFSDLMILSMAFPNILGVYLLSGKVKKALDSYLARVRSGELATRSRRYESKPAFSNAFAQETESE